MLRWRDGACSPGFILTYPFLCPKVSLEDKKQDHLVIHSANG